MNGTIFDLKRFALHDGGGIRSTLFLKGCPLHCPWCQNPEGRDKSVRLHHFASKCIECAVCEGVCPEGALTVDKKNHSFTIDTSRCNGCGVCIAECPARALQFDGREISAREAFRELIEDELFFKTSGGGITLSGGEPLFQQEFSLEILRMCREQKLHTAVESCLAVPRNILFPFIDVTSRFIADIKIFDPKKHLEVTGADNTHILSNIEYLVKEKAELLIRIPLIPGYTSSRENISAIGKYVSGLRKDIPVELVNFNPLAENKYRLFGLAYDVSEGAEPYSPVQIREFRSILHKAGVKKVV